MPGMSIDPSIARVSAFMSLCRAARRAYRRKTPSDEAMRFMLNLEPEILRLQQELHDRSYHPRPYRQFTVADPKPRLICAAAFRDRVAHHALCAELQPVLEADAVDVSFACRRGKGLHAALRWAQDLTRRFGYVLKLDVRSFFATVDHIVLKRLLFRRIREHSLRWLTGVFVDAGTPDICDGKGLPIGNLTSQYFANFYLGPLDQLIKRGLRAPGYCRYMDDLLLFGNSKAKLWDCANEIERFARIRLRLELRSEVTRVLPATEGVPFLGFRIWPHHVRLDGRRRRRFHRRMTALHKGLDGNALAEEDAARSANSLIGWAAQAATLRLRQSLRLGARGQRRRQLG